MSGSIGFRTMLAAASLLLAAALNQDPYAQEKPMTQKTPPLPAQPYVVATAQSIAGTIKDLQSANKAQDLIDAGGIGCRVFIQHEKDAAGNQAEIHEAADDIFVILEGSATFALGGTLDTPKETQPGEWRAPGISGGKEFTVTKGGVLIVPRGTPHRRVTAGLDVTLMVIKSFAPARS